MQSPSLVWAIVVGCLWAAGLRAQGIDPAAPLVFVVADGARAEAIDACLREGGMRRRRVASAHCTPEALRLADVVVVDWPEGGDLGKLLPLGDLERWDRPTVFVGTSGERFARRWGLPSAAEMTRLPDGGRGPEMQRFAPPTGAATEVWRQGHLLHFACELAPADFPAAERAWLLATVRTATTFVTDQPILRHATADEAPLPEWEQQRRRRIDAMAAEVQCDVRQLTSVLSMRRKVFGPKKAQVTMLFDNLLTACVPPGEPLPPWLHWLQWNSASLAWDELSYTWRIDPLARARGVSSRYLVGGARAAGGKRDAAALALAAKVVQRYGARGLDDLATFTCWHDDVCYLWDRRSGYFRVENHREMPVGRRGLQWDVAVLDTATNRELVLGGAAPGKQAVAREAFRTLVERVFLPLLLLAPGTQLIRWADADADGQQGLVVQLAQRSLDPRQQWLLMVVPGTGEIASVQQWEGHKPPRLPVVWQLQETEVCGPLTLPVRWLVENWRDDPPFCITDAAWNPELPAGLDSATERWTQPRDR